MKNVYHLQIKGSRLKCSVVQYAIRRVQVNQDHLKSNGTHQHLFYADDGNKMEESVHTVKKHGCFSI
jgi:transcriptional regulator of NAD metabolism